MIVLSLQDGVYMDEIVDMCVGSLHLMARDPNNRIILKQLNSIPLFVQVSLVSVNILNCRVKT